MKKLELIQILLLKHGVYMILSEREIFINVIFSDFKGIFYVLDANDVNKMFLNLINYWKIQK